MTTRHASCSCGQLSIEATGEPVRISMCHCLACQQRTGSAFGIQARFPPAQLKITGRASEYIRTGDAGGQAKFRFCPDCGSTVYWDGPVPGGAIAIAIGAFADPDFQPPTVSVYTARRHPWATLPASVIENWD